MDDSSYVSISKAATVIDILLSLYFDAESPDIQAIRCDYHRIQNLLSIASDYISDASAQT